MYKFLIFIQDQTSDRLVIAAKGFLKLSNVLEPITYGSLRESKETVWVIIWSLLPKVSARNLSVNSWSFISSINN